MPDLDYKVIVKERGIPTVPGSLAVCRLQHQESTSDGS
jgi:hypothetical protein